MVQVSWDKSPNPGVVYKGEFGGQFFDDEFYLSPDGTKVLYNYYSGGLLGGEQYKAKVTAYYSTGYYNAAADPAESPVYTHTDTSIISDFRANVVTKKNSSDDPTGAYEISLSWKEKSVPTSYRLYVHKYDNNAAYSNYEWTEVAIGTPTTGDIGLRTLRLSNNLPAYRQSWSYKLVALNASSEEIEFKTANLTDSPWSSSLSVGNLTFDTTVAKTLKFEVSQASKYSLVTGETVEFYAVPSSFTNSESDYILSNATLIQSFTKGSLESDTPSNRTAERAFSNGGPYRIVAFVKNGDERTEVEYWVGYNYYGTGNYYLAYVPNN
jgi:hypothetical protein